jgi:hypothetical protein
VVGAAQSQVCVDKATVTNILQDSDRSFRLGSKRGRFLPLIFTDKDVWATAGWKPAQKPKQIP